MIIATPSRFTVLSNSNENEDKDTEEIEEVEVPRNEEAADLYQSRIEESKEERSKETRRGKARQTLPRQSKTNHRVIQERGSNKNL